MERENLDDDDDAYNDYIGGSSSEDDNNYEDNQRRADEYRQKLLGSLKQSGGDNYKKSYLNMSKGEDDPELNIKFNVGFNEDIGQKLISEKKDKQAKNKESPWEEY